MTHKTHQRSMDRDSILNMLHLADRIHLAQEGRFMFEPESGYRKVENGMAGLLARKALRENQGLTWGEYATLEQARSESEETAMDLAYRQFGARAPEALQRQVTHFAYLNPPMEGFWKKE